MTPLENLAITHSLTDSDLTHLSQCPNISQLKGLDLTGDLWHTPMLAPLSSAGESCRHTWKTVLKHVGLGTSIFILPALSHCFQLKCFWHVRKPPFHGYHGEDIRHTSALPSLNKELYPVPQGFAVWGIQCDPGNLLSVGAELLRFWRT